MGNCASLDPQRSKKKQAQNNISQLTPNSPDRKIINDKNGLNKTTTSINAHEYRPYDILGTTLRKTQSYNHAPLRQSYLEIHGYENSKPTDVFKNILSQSIMNRESSLKRLDNEGLRLFKASVDKDYPENEDKNANFPLKTQIKKNLFETQGIKEHPNSPKDLQKKDTDPFRKQKTSIKMGLSNEQELPKSHGNPISLDPIVRPFQQQSHVAEHSYATYIHQDNFSAPYNQLPLKKQKSYGLERIDEVLNEELKTPGYIKEDRMMNGTDVLEDNLEMLEIGRTLCKVPEVSLYHYLRDVEAILYDLLKIPPEK